MTDIGVEKLTAFQGNDLQELCEATEEAIRDGSGFGWLTPPPREVLEAHWSGVLLVPQRHLFIARLEGTVAGSVQLVTPPANNEAGAHKARLETFFIAPWARGHGLARALLARVEDHARKMAFMSLDLDVRATQKDAIRLYERSGYTRWGIRPDYALVGGELIEGYFYSKKLREKQA